MNTNKLVLDLESGESGTALKDKLASLSPGDTVEIEVTAAVDEIHGKQAVFSIRSAEIISDEPEPVDDEDSDEAAAPFSDPSGMLAATSGAKK